MLRKSITAVCLCLVLLLAAFSLATAGSIGPVSQDGMNMGTATPEPLPTNPANLPLSGAGVAAGCPMMGGTGAMGANMGAGNMAGGCGGMGAMTTTGGTPMPAGTPGAMAGGCMGMGNMAGMSGMGMGTGNMAGMSGMGMGNMAGMDTTGMPMAGINAAPWYTQPWLMLGWVLLALAVLALAAALVLAGVGWARRSQPAAIPVAADVTGD